MKVVIFFFFHKVESCVVLGFKFFALYRKRRGKRWGRGRGKGQWDGVRVGRGISFKGIF